MEYGNREAWSLLASGQYTAGCLTSAAYLGAVNGIWPLVTTSTDGHLAFWSLTDTTRCLISHCIQPVHQNSVKALATIELTDSAWLIVTGGDDNALGVTLLTLENESESYDSSSLLVPNAHAAAITAAAITPVPDTNKWVELLIVTASNDQRVKLWRIKVNLKKKGTRGIEVNKEASFSSAIADISSVAVFPELFRQGTRVMKTLICGVGMEIWEHDCRR